MERLIKWFFKAGLVYFIIGGGLGLAFVTFPALQAFIAEGPGHVIKWVHAHINLIGWVSMILFGTVYWIVPRLTGRPIHSEFLAYLHFWLANIGLIGMVGLSAVFGYEGGRMFLQGVPEGQIYAAFTGALVIALVFAFVLYAGILVFAYNVWRSLSPYKRT